MHPFGDLVQNITRRHFLTGGTHLLGGMAMASLLGADSDDGAARRHARDLRRAA